MGVTTQNSYYVSPPIVTSGLILYVDFLNAQSYFSGSSLVRDMSGNNYNGSFTTAISASYVPVPVNGTLFFTGSGNAGGYINFSNATAFNPVPSGISVFGFVQRVTGNTSQLIICKDDGSIPSSRDFQLQITSVNQVQFVAWNQAASLLVATGGSTVSVGSWNYVGGTWDGTTVKTYLNGIQQAFGSLAGTTIHSSAVPVQIGALSGSAGLSSPFNGYIANSQIYNRALSQAEVVQNYNAQKSRFNLT